MGFIIFVLLFIAGFWIPAWLSALGGMMVMIILLIEFIKQLIRGKIAFGLIGRFLLVLAFVWWMLA